MAGIKGKYKLAPFFWRQLLWKVAIIVLSLLILAEIGYIWVKGGDETDDAFASARRLLITLETSAIEGKIISSEDTTETIPKTEEPEQKPAAQPESSPPADDTKPSAETTPPSAEDTKPSAETQPPADAADSTEKKPDDTNTTPQATLEAAPPADAAPAAETPPADAAPAPESKADEEAKPAAVTETPPPQTAAEPAPTVEAEVVNTLNTIEYDKGAELPPISPSKNPPEEFSAEVSEKTEYGSLPKISSSGVKPWKYYSKKITVKDKRPMIAIIITGLGQNKNIGEQAVRLPEAIDLSFSPYAKDLSSWMLSARLSGHEVLLDLPMESANYPVSDPGPLGLLVSKDQQENEIKIKKLMAQNAGYVGFVTPQDEAFLENNELFKSLLQVLAGRGLMIVVGKEPPKNETKEMIEKGNTANVIADNLIDEELVPTAIQARLSLLEQTAKQRGYAVGIANGFPITIKQISEWAAKAEEDGFNLVPVSLIVSKHY